MGNPVVVMNVIDRTNERLAPTNRLVSHSEKPQSVTCACYLQHSRKMPVARGDFHSNTRRHSVELGTIVKVRFRTLRKKIRYLI